MTTRTDRFQAVFLAILLAIGAGLAWGIAVGWTLTTIDDVVFRSPQTNEQIVVLRDGTPLIQSYVGRDYQTKTYRTLDGKRVAVNSSQVENWALLQRPGWPKDGFARLSWSERITPIYRGQSSTEVWYIVHDGNLQGHTHLVGYDKSTKLRIGYIGRHGFRTDTPSLEDQFPVNGRRYRYSRYLGAYRGDLRTDYLLTDEGLVRIDWDTRTVKLLWKDRNPIRVAMSYVRDTNGTLIKSSILVRTLDRVHVLDVDGIEQGNFVLPEDLRDASHLEWTPLPSGKALAWRPSGKHDELFWLDASGVVRQEQVDLLRARRISNREATMILSLAAPVPAGFAVGTAVAPLDPPAHSDAGSYWARLVPDSGRGVARLADGCHHRRGSCLALLSPSVQVRASLDATVGRAGTALWSAGLFRLFGPS